MLSDENVDARCDLKQFSTPEPITQHFDLCGCRPGLAQCNVICRRWPSSDASSAFKLGVEIGSRRIRLPLATEEKKKKKREKNRIIAFSLSCQCRDKAKAETRNSRHENRLANASCRLLQRQRLCSTMFCLFAKIINSSRCRIPFGPKVYLHSARLRS